MASWTGLSSKWGQDEEKTMSREELRELVADFRVALQGLERAGTYAVSGEHANETEQSELAILHKEVAQCQRCSLAGSRRTVVFGVGSETASLMFVGEAPGAEEDRQGQPFVGPSGQLLDKMIVAMGWARDSVYIANVLKCRPPGNRDPKPDEIAACEGYLARQVALIAPRIIITLGKPAANLLLGNSASMGSLRGVWQSYSDIPVMPTYHPAYLLRDPSKKKEAWADLQQVMRRCEADGIG